MLGFVEVRLVREAVVLRRQFDDGGITFNLQIDGFVTVYGCRIYDGKDGKPFISFPARKGNDGKYWNHAYIKLSDEQTEDVAKQVEEKLA